MPGYKQVIPMSVGTTPLGKFSGHALARAGTLMIADMQDLPSIPAAGSQVNIPNVGWNKAKLLLGAGVTQDSASATLKHWTGTTASELIMDRTAKGGLNVIVSQAAGIVANHGAQIILPDSVIAYILANPTHRIAVAHWGKVTRSRKNAANSSLAQSQYWNVGQINNKSTQFNYSQINVSSLIYGSGLYPTPGTYEGNGASHSAVTDLKNAFSSTFTGTVPALSSASGAWNFGAIGGAGNNDVNLKNAHASFVVYALAIEDLTVSGITTTEFVNLTDSAYSTAFGSSGRFGSDTFTPVTALA